MNRTILYYPTIDIPGQTWLRHALLYWDEISSIVPKSYDERILIELSPEIHYLMDEGQFRPIKPEDLIFKQDNWEAFHQFQEEFKQTVLSKEFKRFIKTKYNAPQIDRIHINKIDRIHIDKIAGKNIARVHNNKMTSNILHFLIEEGLAKQDNEDYEWVSFEKYTALLYMSLLAKYLADIDSNQTTIGTDYIAYEQFNFKRVRENEGFPVVSLSLNNILPTPVENVPLEKLLDFKRKRMQNLLHFKRQLSDFQAKVSKAKSQAELKQISITFREELITGVQDLKATLKDSKIESNFKSFKSLISLKSPTSLAAAGAIINGKFGLVNLPINWTAIGLGAIGAIELTGNFIEQSNKRRAKERESPFSYIYQAQRSGILRPYSYDRVQA